MDYSYLPTAANTSSSSSMTRAGTTEKKKAGKRSSGGKGTIKLSTDPQSVAARERRHRISDRFKILQSMVPGGTKMDTVSMLDEAIHYVKFLKTQIWLHQTMMNFVDDDPAAALYCPSSLPCDDLQNFYSTDNLVTVAQPPPAPLPPLPGYGFQGEQNYMRYDTYTNN
ncbi:hypothetical protein SLE2022_105630 [Rubroshorea leprosula]